MTTAICALCRDPVERYGGGGAWLHVGPPDGSKHDPLVECPRCGVYLDGGSTMTAHQLPEPPYLIFGVAFWQCRLCRSVWHRWGSDEFGVTWRRWGPDDPRRRRVESYFVSLGGAPSGEGVQIL